MKMQKRKLGHKLLCALMAVIVLMSLIVLPLADTVNPNDSVGAQYSEGDTAKDDAETAVSQEATENQDGTSSQEATESQEVTTSQQVSPKTDFEYQNDDIIVTAVPSDAAAIPDNAELCVTPITKEMDSEQYSTVEAQVNKNVEAKNQTVTSFLAYDIYFMADGVNYEPEKGTVAVTIQYKNELFNENIKKATDAIKVLHFKENNRGTRIEDVTGAVDVTDVGKSTAVRSDTKQVTNTSSEVSDADTVEFVTNSFSTFVVTGVQTNTAPKFNVTMKFLDNTGAVDTSVTGTYYLNVTGPDSNERYNLPLTVANGTVTATLPGLYDQNGNTKSDGSLYPLTNGTYSVVLFDCPSTCPTNYKWDQNLSGAVQYELNSPIKDNFKITTFTSNITVANLVGTVAITATSTIPIDAKKLSSTEILTKLSPVTPFSVFANRFDSAAHMEGTVAAKYGSFCGSEFGNTSENFTLYSHTITVQKTYLGTTPKTFTFGLFKNGTQIDTTTIMLPTAAGSNTGTASFTITAGETDVFSVYELGASNVKLSVDQEYDGCKLASMENNVVPMTSVVNNTSYIEHVVSLTLDRPPFNLATSGMVIGKDHTVTKNTATNVVTLNTSTYGGQTYTINKPVAFASNFTQATGAFPIDFDTTLTSMAAISVDWAAKAVTSDTVIVKNMTIAEFNANGLTIDTKGKMLLLNIDATGSKNSIDFQGGNGRLTINQVPCAGRSNEANHIVVNVYTQTGGTYAAYSGSIANAGFVMGTLLAPRATITSVGQNYNGNIVAYYATNVGGEIHGNNMGVPITAKFVNSNTSDSPAIVLPNTGGIGTRIFYGVGGGIILLAGILFIFYMNSRKRRR